MANFIRCGCESDVQVPVSGSISKPILARKINNFVNTNNDSEHILYLRMKVRSIVVDIINNNYHAYKIRKNELKNSMVTCRDVSASDLIAGISEEFKNTFSEISPPSWAPFVKTGVHKELPPEDPDWWYIRSAAVLRKIYLKGPLGTRRLKALYGGRKNRGTKQEKARSGSGSIARKILQQLENTKLVETVPAGRQITAKGMSFVDEIAKKVV